MKAIMLSAGEGTRAYPFTLLFPKMYLQICGIPLLEFMLSWFGGAPEITKLYIVVKHDSIVEALRYYVQKRRAYLADIINLFARLGYRVEYVNPDFDIEVIRANEWGTGSDLRLAIKHIASAGELEEDFLVCNADYVIARKLPQGEISPQLNLSDIIKYHRNCRKMLDVVMTMTLIPVERKAATRFGVAKIEEVRGYNLVRGFAEKPDIKDIPENPTINAGVYVIGRDFIISNINEFLPDKPNTNLEKTLLERLAKDEKPSLAAYLLELSAWFDVGTLEQLVDVNAYIASEGGLS